MDSRLAHLTPPVEVLDMGGEIFAFAGAMKQRLVHGCRHAKVLIHGVLFLELNLQNLIFSVIPDAADV